MDGRRFDDFARSIAVSRRAALKTLAGGLAAGVAATVGRGAAGAYTCRAGGVLCLHDWQCCSGSCDQATHQCACDGGLLLCRDRCIAPCVASDQCHAAGVCDPGSGQCTNPPAADGTTCSGNNACYQTFTCQGGVCTASNPVVCTAADVCHAAGTCDPSTGRCASPVLADNASCGSGAVCCGGVCTDATTLANCGSCGNACPAAPACQAAVCDGGTCGTAPDANQNGQSCGTGGRVCVDGACVCPSGLRDCGGTCQACCTADDCPTATCSTATCDNGTCGLNPIPDCCTTNAQCDDGNPCTDDTCNTTTNTCTHTPAANNTGCGTGRACCGGTCTPITTTSNCGTCGHTCPAGATCSNGFCFGGGCRGNADCTGCGDCQTGQCVINPNNGFGTCGCTNTPDCCTATVNHCQRRNNCDVVTCDTTSNTCVHTPVSCSGCTACNLQDGSCTFDTCQAANACQQCNGTQCVANTSLNFASYPCIGANEGKFCYNGQCVSCLPNGESCAGDGACCTGVCQPDIHLNGNFVCTCSPSGIGTCTTNVNCCNNCCNSVGVCADFSEALDNCGACGVHVPAGGICDNGNPTCTVGFHNDNGRCCAAGETNCGSYCANLSVDINNCGACGVPVPSGGVCNSGVPGCTPGFTNCGGTCTSLIADPYNCGYCGHDCGYNGIGVHKGCCLGSCCLI